jgi:hypothetical protein
MREVKVIQWRVWGDDDDTMTVIGAEETFDPVAHGGMKQEWLDAAADKYGEEQGYGVIDEVTGLFQGEATA